MADITLVNFNMLYIKFLDGRVRRQCHLPLGPLYLVSVLRENGVDVDFRDYQLIEEEELFDPAVFCDFLKDPAPVVGLSCMANLLPFVLYSIPFFKEKYPDTTIVLGGIGPAAIEEEILKSTPGLDIISQGEAEYKIVTLLRAIREKTPLDTIDGLFFRRDDSRRDDSRRDGFIVTTPPSSRIEDLDSLPRPSYDGLDFKKYVGHNILGSRGCPFPCTFCSIAPVWSMKSYLRSNDDVIAEMVEMHRHYGVKQFLFQDEFFVAGPERSIDFANKLNKVDINVTYKAFARVDLVNEESLKAMADSGCVEIRFGIESGSDVVLQRTKKGFSAEKALKTVSLAKKIFRSVDAFYVWGFPFETIEDFSASLMQMITLRGMGVRVLPSLLTYLPQTQIYKEIEDTSKLEFCHHLLPEYMISGLEKRGSVRIAIDEKYQDIFRFILDHKEIFPGFFHIDIENNIIPKLELLEEFEFYNPHNTSDESCGAHSPTKVDDLPLTLNI